MSADDTKMVEPVAWMRPNWQDPETYDGLSPVTTFKTIGWMPLVPASAIEASEAKNAALAAENEGNRKGFEFYASLAEERYWQIKALAAENATLRESNLNLKGSTRHWKARAEAAEAAIAKAAQDERDRLYERAMHAPGTVTIVTPGFLEDNGGAMLPSERAALRQEAGRNG